MKIREEIKEGLDKIEKELIGYEPKGTRKEFNKTELGKSMLVQVIVSIAVALIGFIITLIMYFNAAGKYDHKVFTVFQNETGLTVVAIITILLMLSACYFEGRRDGAIAQFAAGKKDKDA